MTDTTMLIAAAQSDAAVLEARCADLQARCERAIQAQANMRGRAWREVMQHKITITHWGRKEDVIEQVKAKAAAAVKALPLEDIDD